MKYIFTFLLALFVLLISQDVVTAYKEAECKNFVNSHGWDGTNAQYNPLKETCTLFFEDGSFKRFSY